MPLLAGLVAALCGLIGLAGCGGSLTVNREVRITAPAALATVQVPFTVTWRSTVDRGGRFAVFVDRLPVPPGHTMRDLAPTGCKRVPTCYPDPITLAGLGVYLTSQDHLTIQSLSALTGIAGWENPPVHTLTVVLYSGTGTRGHRIGDAAWQVEFRGQNPV